MVIGKIARTSYQSTAATLSLVLGEPLFTSNVNRVTGTSMELTQVPTLWDAGVIY